MARLKWLRARPDLLGKAVGFLLRCLGSTIRLKVENLPEAREHGVILAGWHGRSLLAGYRFRDRGYWVMVSHSRDGEIQANVFGSLGFQIVRGSTKRGGAQAAVEAIRVLRKGGTFAMTPDGPRGPSGVLQPGIMTMAQKSGAVIVPTGISARPRYLVKSWDRYLLPWPFARAVILCGEPIFVPTDLDEARFEALRVEIEAKVTAIENEAEQRLFGTTTR